MTTPTSSLPRGTRRRVAAGIYEDRYGLAAIVTVGAQRDEGRFPTGTALEDIEAWRLERRAKFLKDRGTVGRRGSLAADALAFVASMPAGRPRDDYDDLLTHWRNSPLGEKARADITEMDVRTQLGRWEATASASTRRHRLRALRVLYRRVDGAGSANPTVGITITPEKALPREIPIALVEQLLENLPDRGRPVKGETKRNGPGRSTTSETKIRLRVMAWTGLPQMQLERLRKVDVDFAGARLRLRPRRKGRGVSGAWVPLIPPAVDALRAYAAANLWEQSFSRQSMNKTWQRTIKRTKAQLEAQAVDTGDTAPLEAFEQNIPEGCRPYDLRHSFLSEALRQTGDLAAVGELAQHANLQTTKRYTEGAVSDRARAAVAAMSQRWQPAGPRLVRPGVR